MRIDFKRIYIQQSVLENLLWRVEAEDICAQYPQAERIEVASHARIPDLRGADPREWIHTKNDALVLGARATFKHEVNGRSADFIAASYSNGCLSSCQYCYVARRKGGSNPLTLFVNIDEIGDAIARHCAALGPKREANQTDPHLWTYDIGCNADLSLDALVSDLPGKLLRRFKRIPNAKATFATKTVNDDYWLKIDPAGRARLRYSLMPGRVARAVDIRTSPIGERIRSINRLVEGGYEVHLNFSPIILFGGDAWRAKWLELFAEINDVLSPEAKRQLACEAFFLSHSEAAHALNLQWNPKGEEFLWAPPHQVPKPLKPDVLVYHPDLRRRELAWFREALATHLPYCRLRYAF